MTEPQIVEFGPYRVIGMSLIGKPESMDFSGLWQKLHPRWGEIASLPEVGFFGVCRCIPGVTDGSFEYIACLPVADDAAVPEGMVEAQIGKATYAAFEIDGLAQVSAGYEAAGKWIAEHPSWESCCCEGNCDCAHFPWFELYPPDFHPQGKLFIYAPLRPKSA